MSGIKSLLWALTKYSLGFALLGWVIWSHWEPADGSPGLREALTRPIHYGPLTLALLLSAGGLVLTFLRWFLLVQAQGLPFTAGDAVRLGAIGYALSTLLPGSVGGDIMKAACLARGQKRRTVAVATVVFDRGLGLVALFWLVAGLGVVFWLLGSLRGAVLGGILLGAWAIVAGSVGFWLLLGCLPVSWGEPTAVRLETRFPRLGPALAEVWRAVWMYRRQGPSILRAMLLAVLGHCGFVLAFYCCALTLAGVGLVPSWDEHFLIVPVGMTIQAGFPAPGGVGGGEYAFGKLYELLGYAFSAGVLASLVQRAVSWGLALVCYVAYLRMRPALLPAVEPVVAAQPLVAAEV